jgi:ABC-type lipoprotein release transport system permease subunit
MSYLGYLLRRALHYWHVLLLLALGVLLATTLLASSPLIVESVMNFSLPYTIRNAATLDKNIRLLTYGSFEQEDFNDFDNETNVLIDKYLGFVIQEIISEGGSGWAYPWIEGLIVDDQRVNVRFYEDIENQVEFIEGDWPIEQSLDQREASIVIGEQFASDYDLQVGDLLPLSIRVNDEEPSIHYRITGIVRPINSLDPYWFGEFNPLRVKSGQRWLAEYSGIVSKNDFFDIQQEFFSVSRAEFNWNVIIDPSGIEYGDISALRSNVHALKDEILNFPQRISIETNLETLLYRFAVQSNSIRVVLYVLVIEVVLVALYYITMVATVSSKQSEGEFSVISSRGGSFRQIFNIQAWNALVVGGLTLILAPFLALLLVWGLSNVEPLAEVSNADWSVGTTWSSWSLSAVGVVICVVGLLYPIHRVVKRSVVAHVQTMSRTEEKPIWQKYYLDVIIVIFALILLWRLNIYGDISQVSAGIGGRIDWLLLLAPMVLLVGSSLIILRALPVLLSVLAKITSFSRGLPAVLAMWETSRNPNQIAQLVLLLTLTMALGIFSTGLHETLEVSEHERAFYAAGSELRLSVDRFLPLADISSELGVENVSAVWRGTGSVNIRNYRIFPTFELIAIEPYSFVEVSRYRSDFASEPMGKVISDLVVDQEKIDDISIYLPETPNKIGMWVAAYERYAYQRQDEEQTWDLISLRTKVKTSNGEMMLVKLSPIPDMTIEVEDEEDSQISWRMYEGELPELSEESYPLSLHSLWINTRRGPENVYRFAFIFDDLYVVDRQTEEVIVYEDFESPLRIWQADDPATTVMYTKQKDTHTGKGSLYVETPTTGPWGIAITQAGSITQDPLPVLVSEEFINNTQLDVGDKVVGQINGIPITMEIFNVIRYFPTLFDTPGNGFVVTARDSILSILNKGVRSPQMANEYWLEMVDQQGYMSTVDNFSDVFQLWELDEVRRSIKADPLSLGLRSVTNLGYLLTAILSITGFVTFFYVTTRRRESMFSILRSMGLSPGQLYGSLVLEQMIIILTGLTLGTIIGIILNRLVLTGLPISFSDRPPIPPFIPQTDWLSIIRLYLILAGSFIIAMGIGTFLLMKARIHRVMRIGQE